MSQLGRLTRIKDIRQTWPNEARNFTPWLAMEENLSILSETLGFGPEWLEVDRVEKDVGTFRADIVCRETGPESRVVLIENQFGTTDHDHLGKLLTYAAGNDAKILIWISEQIREEHEAAIDFINDVSGDDFLVFGIELELWQIGDSDPAPKFNVVAKPNSWVRRARAKDKQASNKPLGPGPALKLRYWTAFNECLEAANPPFNPVSPQPATWISHGIGKTSVALNITQNSRDRWVRVEIYLSGKVAKGYFHMLRQHQEEIETALGYPLDWQELEQGMDSRICVSKHQADPAQEAEWSEQHQWLVERAIEFYNIFHPIVRELDRGMAETLG